MLSIFTDLHPQARARGCYAELRKADLSRPLPLADASSDALVCVGTTTYLEPAALDEWLRVVRPGGLLAFTHKSACIAAWEARQQQLVDAGSWAAVWRSDGLPYLPVLPDECRERDDEVVHIYIYRKL